MLNHSEIRIPFPSHQLAVSAKSVLLPDEELKADLVKRDLLVEDCVLLAIYRASTARMLRVSVNGFMDSILLVIDVLEAFHET